MMYFQKLRAVLALLGVKVILGSTALENREHVYGLGVKNITKVIKEGPTHVTNQNCTAKDNLTTIPHSCFTHTILTPWAPTKTTNASMTAVHCGIQADCIAVTTTTIYAPPHDIYCPDTPTIKIASPSPTCTRGCRKNTITEIVTLDSASQKYLVKRATQAGPTYPLTLATSSVEAAPTCTTTFRMMADFQFGPTKTYYPNVHVKSVTLDCVGCEVVTKNIAGLGPVAIFTTVVTDEATTTSTSFVCATASVF